MNDLNKLQLKIQELEQALYFHRHTGTDGQPVMYQSLGKKKMYITHSIMDGSVAANYGVFFIAPFSCTVTQFVESHQTPGTDPGSVTLQLEKLTGTQSAGSGSDVLVPSVNLKSAANTVVYYPDSATGNSFTQGFNSNGVRDVVLQQGDRLALKDTGTLTDVSGITVLLELTYN